MEIVLYPNPVLRRKTPEITDFGPELERRAAEMLELMYKLKGVGLAAPQVGRCERMLVLNPTGKPGDELALVNPTIKSRKGDIFGEEGCLSFPGIYAEVDRAKEIVIDYQDPRGEWHRDVKLSDFTARIVQHENDHLEGILFTDRMSPADKVRVKHQLKALEEKFASQSASRT